MTLTVRGPRGHWTSCTTLVGPRVHKDIKPTNFLVSAASGEVRLTGFGIASRLERERQSLHPVETIAGTLAYMAPEQTGRMNRSIDSRSDLYALGVTFYQMLTGALPFAAAEPWIGCTPISPGGRWNPPSGGRKAPASCRRSS